MRCSATQRSLASRKAEGKASSTAELPPEYLTSPLSQQSQVLLAPDPAHRPVCPQLPPEYLTGPLSQQSQVLLAPGPAHRPVCPQLPPKRDETALQEEEELQLALALSQSEAEEKERMVSRGRLPRFGGTGGERP